MTRVVGVGDGKTLQDSKLCFDQIEPGSFRRSPNGVDAQAAQQSKKTRMISSASRALIRPVRAPESLSSAELFLGRPITLFGIRTGLSGIPFVHYDLFDSKGIYGRFCAAKNDSNLLCIDARWQARREKPF